MFVTTAHGYNRCCSGRRKSGQKGARKINEAFHEKLQYLRKQHHLTQDQLAEKLYVSRAAVSKWESGKGYPNIESLKRISEEFHVSIDELLSGKELLEQAETENKTNLDRLNGFIYAVIDVSAVLFLFLPLFGKNVSGHIQSVTLFGSPDLSGVLQGFYGAVLLAMTLCGVVGFRIQRSEKEQNRKRVRVGSIAIHAAALVLFMLSRQPYVSTFLFIPFLIKGALLIRGNGTGHRHEK